MIKLLVRQTNGEIQEQEIQNGMNFQPAEGEQFYFVGADNYTFNLASDEKSVVLILNDNGQKVEIILDNMADLIKNNNPADAFSLLTALGVSTTAEGDEEILKAVNNPNLESGQLVDLLKDSLAQSSMAELDGAIIDDFGSLAEALEAAAAGENQGEAFLNLVETRGQEATPTDTARGERLENEDTSEDTNPTEDNTEDTEDTEDTSPEDTDYSLTEDTTGVYKDTTEDTQGEYQTEDTTAEDTAPEDTQGTYTVTTNSTYYTAEDTSSVSTKTGEYETGKYTTSTEDTSWEGAKDISHVTYLVEDANGNQFYLKTGGWDGNDKLNYEDPLKLVNNIETNNNVTVIGYEIKAGKEYYQANIDPVTNEITTVDGDKDANYPHRANASEVGNIDLNGNLIDSNSPTALSSSPTQTNPTTLENVNFPGHTITTTTTTSTVDVVKNDSGEWVNSSGNVITTDDSKVTSQVTTNVTLDNGNWVDSNGTVITTDSNLVSNENTTTSSSSQMLYSSDQNAWYSDPSYTTAVTPTNTLSNIQPVSGSSQTTTITVYSDDNGQTWHTDSALTNDYTGNGSVTTTSTTPAYTNNYYSNDGGTTWYDNNQYSGNSVDTTNITFESTNTSYNTTTLYSNDGGKTWHTDSGLTTDYNGNETVTTTSSNSTTTNIDVTLDDATDTWIDSQNNIYQDSDITSKEENLVDGNGNEVTSSSPIDGGDGTDKLTIDFNDNDTIDLSDIASKSDNMEVVDFTDGDNQTININIQDIIDMTDDDNELIIKGDNGDEINLEDSSNWTKSTDTTTVEGEDGEFFEYTNNNVTVLIENDIDVDDI